MVVLPFVARPALACSRTKLAELPLALIESFAVVTASLAGRVVSLIVDTGAEHMLVTPAIADSLQLPLDGVTRIYGTGGSQQVRVVRLPGLRLGGAPMPNQLAPVSALPLDLAMTPPLAGLLGASVLSHFDLEMDVPGRRMALWSSEACTPPLGGTVLPMQVSQAGEPFMPIRVNGHDLLAEIDTGSRATILFTEAALRLGLDAPVSANTAPGVDGALLPLKHTRVQLALGEEASMDVPVSIAPLQSDRGDMLLGLDQLGRRPFWLAYAAGLAVLGPVA